MDQFFTQHIEGDFVYLGEDEARHCAQVMRKRTGDKILVFNGLGGLFEVEILETGKKKCVGKIIARHEERPKRPYSLHIAIAPTKNIARFEWFLEKSVEMGIETITPLLCAHSERRRLKNERLQRVILAAMKQSKQIFFPQLNELTPFADFIKNTTKNSHPQKFIALMDAPVSFKEAYQPKQDAIILIGPEGDFSAKEIELALNAGFDKTEFGKSRLRTETAGVVACAAFHLLNW